MATATDPGGAFARYKYRTGGNRVTPMGLAGAGVVLLSFVGARFTPWALCLLLFPLVLLVRHLRRVNGALVIAGRYVIAGDAIMYYRNVARVQLDRERRTLTLFSATGHRLVIEAERFPTNARKAEKIRINTSAKFDKAVAKLTERLKEVVPDAVP